MPQEGSPTEDELALDLRRPLAARLGLGVSGQAFGRIILAVNTIALVPILVQAWGLGGYGQWLALTALSSWMSYSNFGLVTSSANEMVMAAGARDFERARRSFQMSVNLTLYLVVPLVAACCLAFAALPLSQIFHLSQISNRQAELVLVLMGVQLIAQTLRGLTAAALYATGSYGLSYYIAGCCRLLELVGIAGVVLLLHGGQTAAAGVLGVVALIELAVVTILARRLVRWARPDPTMWDWGWIKRQIKPASGFAISNLSTQTVLVQGPRLVLGALLGGQAVAVYAIYATAMRLVDQLVLMLALPLETELAHALGAADLSRMRKLVTWGVQTSWLLFAAVSALLMGGGALIFRFWTHGRLVFDPWLMSLFLLMSAGNQFGRVSTHALVGANRMFGPSFVTLATSLSSITLGAFLTMRLGFVGMVFGGIVGELLGSIVCTFAVSRLLEIPYQRLMADMFDYGSSVQSFRKWLAAALARRALAN